MTLLVLAALLAGPAPAGASVVPGLDRLEAGGFKELQGKKVGLITNHTGRTLDGRPAGAVLAKARGVKLVALFTPEHGFLGTAPAGARIHHSTDPATGLPVYSLYGATKRPTPAMLKGIDTLVFDIQDVGARFYTYLVTMAYAMEAAADAGIGFVVLDRPNPVGGAPDGALKIPQISAFTSYFPVPIQHGLTPGELARLHNDSLERPVKLTVVPMDGWKRGMLWKDTGLPWVDPSPNIRSPEAAILYQGVGIFESTNLSVGRGTPSPFEWVGAPWLHAREVVAELQAAGIPGVRISREERVPKEDRYKGQRCPGIRIRIKDADKVRPLEVFVRIALALRERHSYEFELRWEEARRMVGNDEFEKLFLGQARAEEILAAFDRDARAFEKTRKPFLLYP